MATLTQNIETLFAQVSSFEAGSREFSTGAFMSNLDGVISALEMLGNQPDQSAAVDDCLYRKVREADQSQSLLRFASSNIIGMFLYAWAAGAPGYLRSYQELVRSRPENAANDGDFIEQVIVPRLLQLRELRGDVTLGGHLLLKVAEFLQTFRAATTFPSSASRADLERRGLQILLLGFARRRLAAPGRRLREEPGSLEYGLKRDRFFEWMRAQGRSKGLDVEPYLGYLDLLPPVSWLRRVLNRVGRVFAGLVGWVKPGHGWLPAGGVFWSGLWILIALLATIAVPAFWLDRYVQQLREFRKDGMDLAGKQVEVLSPHGEERR